LLPKRTVTFSTTIIGSLPGKCTLELPHIVKHNSKNGIGNNYQKNCRNDGGGCIFTDILSPCPHLKTLLAADTGNNYGKKNRFNNTGYDVKNLYGF